MKYQLKREKQKEVYNEKAKDLPIIPTGATVRIQDGKTWSEKALVTGKSRMPRSYNFKSLLLSKEPSSLQWKSMMMSHLLISPVDILINFKKKIQLHLLIDLLLVYIQAVCDQTLNLRKGMVFTRFIVL